MCRNCRKQRFLPATQLMGALPAARMAVAKPTFYHSSIDFFGPLIVVFGRKKTIKRYGGLFTCLTTRGVHIEVAESLSTPDFINALRRFISMRGCPHSVFSDNGTNFRGAEAELRQSNQDLGNDPLMTEFATQKGFKWTFKPKDCSTKDCWKNESPHDSFRSSSTAELTSATKSIRPLEI